MEMLRIYSPHGREEEISKFLEERMKKFGVGCRRDDVGNVICEVGVGGGLLLLCSHMDTVTGELEVRVEAGTIYGRGACDAKASVAAMALALARLADEDLDRKVVFAAVVDEEGSSTGFRNLLREGVDARYAVFGEPSGNSRVVISYRGSLSLKVLAEGDGGHPASSPLYDNAVERAIGFFYKLRESLEEEGKSPSRSTNVNILEIHGGEGNKIPSTCTLLINIRFPPRTGCRELVERVEALVSKYGGVRTEVMDCTEAYEANRYSKVVKSAFRAIWRVRGERARLSRKTGTGDMNLLPREIDAVTLGPGDPRLEHTDRESVEISEFLEAIDIYEQIVRELVAMERVD